MVMLGSEDVSLLCVPGGVCFGCRDICAPTPVDSSKTAFVLIGAGQHWDDYGDFRPSTLPPNSDLIVVDPLDGGRTELRQTVPHKLFRKTDRKFFQDDWSLVSSVYQRVFILCYTTQAVALSNITDLENVLWIPLAHSSGGYQLEKLNGLSGPIEHPSTDDRRDAFTALKMPMTLLTEKLGRLIEIRDNRQGARGGCFVCRYRQYLELYKQREWAARSLQTAKTCTPSKCRNEWGANDHVRAVSLVSETHTSNGSDAHFLEVLNDITAHVDSIAKDVTTWMKSNLVEVTDNGLHLAGWAEPKDLSLLLEVTKNNYVYTVDHRRYFPIGTASAGETEDDDGDDNDVGDGQKSDSRHSTSASVLSTLAILLSLMW
eukprot:TRINITY_DN24472_c0_g1_i1.p1 TRINITY_DN24472_c0_g1~~TRINITY_DN24472_c0_g1_i1.p1  ORF type:complete len:426 (+),score=35.83 TRINITY_DN24472_c0_g1_i1:161-1279(+)